MKQLIILPAFLLALCAMAVTWSAIKEPVKKNERVAALKRHTGSNSTLSISKKIRSKALEAKKFVLTKGCNRSFCFLIDMTLPSGQNRFFIYDLKKDSLVSSGLVTHGRCNQDWLEGRRYGNNVGCGCTSLGKYKIGASYSGRFGLAYKLYGMEKTNDNAFRRYVVLHAHKCVPETEVGNEICQSDGCPTVSPGFLNQLATMIRQSDQPVLLWIFD